jgi:transcriptional regulator GlxA family with amidase domain
MTLDRVHELVPSQGQELAIVAIAARLFFENARLFSKIFSENFRLFQ